MKELNISDKENIKEKEKKVEKKESKTQDKVIIKERKKFNLKEKKWTLIFVSIGFLFILGIAAFYYFGIYKYNYKNGNHDIVNLTENYILSKNTPTIFGSSLLNQPEEPRTEESTINGLLFTKSEYDRLSEKRPVAVMISNHVHARPMSGLNSADIVYESLAESGITRHLAIFWSQGPNKIGSMRSARQYHLEWLSPYDPLFLHDGCATTENPRTNACGNIYLYGIKSLGTQGAWRWNDGVRPAPHNEYTSAVTAWELAAARGWAGFPQNINSWEFKNDTITDNRGEGGRYKIIFHNRLRNDGLYDVVWQYDKATNSYNRWVGNSIDVDQETDSQVNAKTVIIQETTITPTFDRGRIITDTIGEGNAIILMDGDQISGKWKKDSRTDRAVFYKNDGTKVQFNRGRIWISIIAQNTGEFDIIE